MSLVRSTVVYTAAQAVLLVVGLASSIVISRLLGPEGRGVLALVALLATTATLLATLGFGSSYAFLVGKRLYHAESLVGSAVVTSTAFGLGTIAVLLLASGPLLATVLQGLTFWEYLVALIALPFGYLTFFLVNLLTGAGLASRAAVLQLAAGVFGAAVSITAVVSSQGDVATVVLAGTLGTIAVAIYTLALAIRNFGLRFDQTGTIARTAAHYGARAYVGSLGGQLWLRADVFILNGFAGTAAVGQYSLATSLAEKVWLLDSSVSQVTLAQVIGSSPDESARLVARTSRNVAFISGASCLAVALAAPWLVPLLFGDEFRAAILPLWLLLPGVLAIGIARPLSSYFSGQLGRPQITSSVSLATAAVGVAAYLLLVPPFGATGAALGSTIAYALPLVAYLPLFRRHSGLGMRDVLLLTREDLKTYGRLARSALSRIAAFRQA